MNKSLDGCDHTEPLRVSDDQRLISVFVPSHDSSPILAAFGFADFG